MEQTFSLPFRRRLTQGGTRSRGLALDYPDFQHPFVASFIASFVDFSPSLRRISDEAHDKARDKVYQSHRLRKCHSGWVGSAGSTSRLLPYLAPRFEIVWKIAVIIR